MKTIILIAVIAAVASPIFADEALEPKKHEKRGLLGLGYGGYYPGVAAGYGGYSSYASPVVSHAGVLPAYNGYNAYNGHVGAGYHAPVYSAAPLRLGYNYNGLGGHAGLGLGHGLNYYNGVW